MGCNYYLRRNYCPCCGTPREETHIGKSSVGWRWAAHIKRGIATFEEYKKFLNTGTIYDEYGEICSLDELLKLISAKKNERSHMEVSHDTQNEGAWDECDWSLNDFC